MSSIKERLKADMITAMKNKETERLAAIRFIQAAVKKQEVDTRKELDDAALVAILMNQAKQRKDSITQFEAGGRTDLADIEKAELAVLVAYMPAGLSDDEIAAEVKAAVAESGAAGPQDMGKVKAIVKPKLAGRADMTVVSALVKKALTPA